MRSCCCNNVLICLLQFHGSHGALGNRARKLDQGILIIRFEMPFNVWCLGCNHLIAKGVRFNAEKKKIGKYHTTTIWSFRMKAPCCGQEIEVHTDPKNAEYVVVSGAKRKALLEKEKMEDGIVSLDPEGRERPTDAIGKLEVAEMDRRRAMDTYSEIDRLRGESMDRFGDDVARNRELRRVMRSARKEEQQRAARRDELGLPNHIALLPETGMDGLRAASVNFGGGGAGVTRKSKQRRIKSSGIFGQSRAVGSGKSSSSVAQIRKRIKNK